LLAEFLSSSVSAWAHFTTDVDFCRYLVKEIGVAAIPTSVFFSDPARAPQLARFCFAKKDETLNAAAARLVTRKKVTS
jgi:aspartate/methionine/tyrosine aminotransferase